jgi:hypothetical protein
LDGSQAVRAADSASGSATKRSADAIAEAVPAAVACGQISDLMLEFLFLKTRASTVLSGKRRGAQQGSMTCEKKFPWSLPERILQVKVNFKSSKKEEAL